MLTLKSQIRKFASRETVINEAQAILADAAQEDKEFLEKRGYNYTRIENAAHSHAPRRFKTRAGCLHSDEIEKLAISYGLRFLPLEKFEGLVGPQAAAAMRSFERDHAEELRRGSNNLPHYYVLAPAKNFRLKFVEKRGIGTALLDATRDPVLFALADDGSHYHFVHEWGNDLSFIRRIVNWPLQRARNFFMVIWSCIAIVAVYAEIAFNRGAIGDWPLGIAWLVIAVAAFWSSLWAVEDVGHYGSSWTFARSRKFHKNKWDSERELA